MSASEVPKESKLRDYLAQHLDLIEAGLELVDTEFTVDNPHGAGGRIDILARDAAHNLVVVELKRSEQSARQALHELEKYVALLAADKGIRLHQLRCILVSTTWNELLVPFARAVTHTDFYLTGRVLHLDSTGTPASTEPVILPELASGLETYPGHLLLLYTTEQQRDACAVTVADVLDEFAIEDYITADFHYVGGASHVIYPFGHCITLARFPRELRPHIAALCPEQFTGEFDDEPDWTEQVVQGQIVERAAAGEVSIRCPAQLPSSPEWARGDVRGHGKYDDPLVWPRRFLERVIDGVGEVTSMPYDAQVTVGNGPAWTRLRADLEYILMGVDKWASLVAALLDELELRPSAELWVHAYVPKDICRVSGLR